MELFGALFGLTFVWWSILIAVLSLALPILWLWMLIDSLLRPDWEYPNGSSNEKLVWVLLIGLVQIPAAFYFFMVYRKVARGSVAPPMVQAGYVAASPAPSPVPAEPQTASAEPQAPTV